MRRSTFTLFVGASKDLVIKGRIVLLEIVIS